MTAMELYKILNDADLDYEVREIFDGLRVLNFEVEEEELVNEEI